MRTGSDALTYAAAALLDLCPSLKFVFHKYGEDREEYGEGACLSAICLPIDVTSELLSAHDGFACSQRPGVRSTCMCCSYSYQHNGWQRVHETQLLPETQQPSSI